MGKRGLSMEEKRQAMQGLLHEHKTPFTLRQLEKMGGKAGVTSMSVKDVLQTLVDDNLIELDKIGITNFYWSFPSKAVVNLRNKIEAAEADNTRLAAEAGQLDERIEELRVARKDTPERTAQLEALVQLENETVALQAKLNEAKSNDPGSVAALQQKVKISKEASVRWTDNTWALSDHLRKKYNIDRSDVEKQLKMKSDFDYPVFKQPTKKKLLAEKAKNNN